MADKFVSRLLLIGLAIVILVILVSQYHSKQGSAAKRHVSERYSEPAKTNDTSSSLLPGLMSGGAAAGAAPAGKSVGKSQVTDVYPSEALSNEDYKAVDFNTESKLPSDCFPRDKLSAEDLLPKDAANSKWAQVNPAGQGDVKDQNLLTAGFHMGINTVGQTLRNANYQLRSDPPNPRFNVGPWNQTTIEYDNSRRMFELGDC